MQEKRNWSQVPLRRKSLDDDLIELDSQLKPYETCDVKASLSISYISGEALVVIVSCVTHIDSVTGRATKRRHSKSHTVL